MVGCGHATDVLKDGQKVTVSCAEGDTGFVYSDMLDFSVQSSEVTELPDLPLKIMMNVGNPDRAFDFARLPNEGVGLARLEFIINRMIGVHPRALLEFDQQTPALQNEIRALMQGYDHPGRVLRWPPDRRDRDAGRRLLAEACDRAAVRLQIQRVRQPGGRR
ncbi:Phosphoenolpyruvate synthase [Serratia marcescens]|uniref:Phosphoenolpyruvate synthase n=1 Tax=Serratia marcescens TaxID=615 RepID=A0A379ZUC5_SERMA|nr:Phosphoenolpyruvate synthase [Serratia marcescens]